MLYIVGHIDMDCKDRIHVSNLIKTFAQHYLEQNFPTHGQCETYMYKILQTVLNTCEVHVQLYIGGQWRTIMMCSNLVFRRFWKSIALKLKTLRATFRAKIVLEYMYCQIYAHII